MSGSIARQNTPNSGGSAGAAAAQQNRAARAAILAIGENMVQPIYTQIIASPGTTNNVITLQPRMVGLLKRFWIELTATIVNADPVNSLALTPFGPANLLSNVLFTDLSNNNRINTAGWHLHLLSSVKRGRVYDAAYVNDSPIQMGSTQPLISAPSIIDSNGGTGTVKMLYEVPITYNDTDFRGLVYLGVTGSTPQLQMTINPTPAAPSYGQSGDPSLAIYAGSANASISTITVNVYQNYLDRLPSTPGKGVTLPINDLSTVYLLNTITLPKGGIVQGQDYPIPYAPFRDFVSTSVMFDNGGQLNPGSDVSYWAIQLANYINPIKVDPGLLALWTRTMMQNDMPPGMAYFSHRHKPISTLQYGNQELILNASQVNANANLNVGYEMFALVSLIAQASALSIA
jgi:hypothetical protein